MTTPTVAQVREWYSNRLESDEDFREECEAFGGYESFGFYDDVQTAAGLLREEIPGMEDFSVSFLCDSEGLINGAFVESFLPDQADAVYLARYVEVKHLTYDRLATGVEGFWGIIEVLLTEFLRVIRVAGQLQGEDE